MTNERAVEILNLDLDILGQYGGETAEAYKMAIKALEPKPIEKFDDVKTHIQRLAGDYKCWDNRLTWEEALELNRMLEAQPNSNEFFNFDAPMVKNSEAVSREAVQDLISRWLSDYLLDETREALETINYKIGDMPPVNPQRKVGKWIEVEDNPDEYHYECSECGQRMNWLDEYDHYCCNCGSKNWEG